MLQDNSTHGFKGVQMTQVSINSPDQLVHEENESIQKIKSNWWSCNIKRCVFLIFLVLTSSLTLYQINTQKVRPTDPDVVIQGPFKFPVFCPYGYINDLMYGDDGSGYEDDLRLRRLLSTYSFNLSVKDTDTYDFYQTYLVQIDFIETKPGLQKALYYCGLVTQFGTPCSGNVKFRCSNPGPLFDLKTNQYADIVWINNINPASNAGYINDTSCMNTSSPWCDLQTKNETSVTFLDPTNMDYQQKQSQTHKNHTKVKISASAWPISAHVHGAEVRPTFDGNPMSWIDNKGNRGLGAFSLDDDCYYSQFDKADGDNSVYHPPDIIVNAVEDENYEKSRTKISRYPNKQNPGNLWYHDHAMRLTLFNVRHGLAGMYILRDPEVERYIDVPPENEKMLMMTVKGWENSTLQVVADTVYRFRILNSNFTGSTTKFSFAYNDCNSTERIYFTQIGADSSLFHQGIENVQEIELAAAERAQLLIKFDKDLNKAKYSICDKWARPQAPASTRTPSASHSSYQSDNKLPDVYGKIEIKDKIKISTTRNNITDVNLKVPYTSLSQVDSSQIAVKRMRPLTASKIFVQSKNSSSTMFMINGRSDFHLGQSENPTIGSIQDWYIINTMGSQHPIHIHLINFQVVRVMDLISLKYSNPDASCTIYELDFLIQAMKTHDTLKRNTDYFPDPNNLDIVNYEKICRDNNTIYLADKFYSNLAKVNLQSKKDENNVSGIDVEKVLTDFQRKLLNIAKQNDRTYKYVKDLGHESSKPHYKRWKDTGSVDGKTVSVFRIRWAKSSYDKNKVGGDTYFHVPLDQLREFPGFVYHCHILGHEDSEMMRPIMLQLPSNTKLNNQIQCNKKGQQHNYSWKQKVNCINEKCKKQPRN